MGGTEHTTSRADERTDPFEWRTLDGDTHEADDDPDRRRGLARPAVGSVLVVLLALLLIGVAPQAAVAHTSFTAGDVSLSTNAGRVTALTVAPAGDVHYDGLEAVPSAVDVTVSARLNSTDAWETVATQSVSVSTLQGSVNYSFAEVSLLSTTSMAAGDFAAADGSTSTTDVDLRVQVTLVGAGPGGGDVTAGAVDTFTVSVTNEAAGAGVGGQGNTAGSGA